jgi:hypothetical protein
MKLLLVLVVFVNNSAVSSRKLDRVPNDGTEHSLEIESRTDCLTDVAQRSQLADGLRKLTGPRFEFLEQSRILDCDHGLIRECFEELDLLVRKGPNFRSPNHNSSDGNTFAE